MNDNPETEFPAERRKPAAPLDYDEMIDLAGKLSREDGKNWSALGVSQVAEYCRRASDILIAKLCTCPTGDGSLRWPCPAHPPKPYPCRCPRGTRCYHAPKAEDPAPKITADLSAGRIEYSDELAAEAERAFRAALWINDEDRENGFTEAKLTRRGIRAALDVLAREIAAQTATEGARIISGMADEFTERWSGIFGANLAVQLPGMERAAAELDERLGREARLSDTDE